MFIFGNQSFKDAALDVTGHAFDEICFGDGYGGWGEVKLIRVIGGPGDLPRRAEEPSLHL